MDLETARSEPVDGSKCIWCKQEPSDDVTLHAIDTGESVCDSCMGDMRAFKRKIVFQVYTSVQIEQSDRREISETAYRAGREKMDELGYTGKDHGPSTSNAESGYTEVD
jgi:hypothetical protein